jgi:transposase
MTIDGTIHDLTFEQYVERILVPTVKPRQIVILGNLAVHKQAAVQQAITAVGARMLRLPSHSPDFNPIVLIISAIKQFLRCVEATIREGLEAASPHALDDELPQEALNCFRRCGYLVQ